MLAIVQAGCQSDPGQAVGNFWGSYQAEIYRNDFFGFDVRIPAGWVLQDTAASQALARNMQRKLMDPDSTTLEIPFAAQLLTAYKYPVGASVTFNPSAQIVAERIDQEKGVTDEHAYLAGVRRLLEETPLEYTFPEDPYSTRMGQRDFVVLETDLYLGDLLTRQMYYITIEKEYALGFVLSFASKEQRDELEQLFLETLAFN
ncbi:MAG: hypothetical protein AAFV07_14160 [Bacteroidota bacterium]